MIRRGTYNEPLTPKEQVFASENYSMIEKFLSAKRLSFDEWYDVLALKYLKSVKKWFARPDLHQYTFYTIVKTDLHYAVLSELNKQKQQPTVISLYEEIPGMNGVPFMECITYQNLNRIYEEGAIMNIKYNVKLPEVNRFGCGKKSDEVLALESFLNGSMKNMCFEYDTPQEAKRKLSTVRSYRKRMHHEELYNVYKSQNCIYIVRLKQK